MKRTRLMWLILSLAAVAATGMLYAQNMGTPGPKFATEEPDEEDLELAHWLEVTSPGTEHNPLRRIVGVWKVTMKIWERKGEEALEGQGRAVNRMILGGRFLQSTYRGKLSGQDFVGLGVDGYDMLRKKYVGVWFDNQSTAMRTYEGTSADDGKSITMTSSQIHAETVKPLSVRSRTTIVDGRTYRYEQWAREDGGEEFKSMEIEYTRVGSDG